MKSKSSGSPCSASFSRFRQRGCYRWELLPSAVTKSRGEVLTRKKTGLQLHIKKKYTMVITTRSQRIQISSGFTEASQFWSYIPIKNLLLFEAHPKRHLARQTWPKGLFYLVHHLSSCCFKGKNTQLLVHSAKPLLLSADLCTGHQGKGQQISCPEHKTWTRLKE